MYTFTHIGGEIGLHLNDDFVSDIDPYYLGKIYDQLDVNGKKDFLKYLIKLSGEVLFNHFHLRVLRFAKEKRLEKELRRVKINLSRINKM